MKCSVEGCDREATRTVGKTGYHFCQSHSEAWGYYRRGYYEALGKEGNGCLHKGLWDKAMKAFLEWCRIEIAACTQIAEALIKEANR